jgi:uncharacterized membrane protein
MTVTPRAHPRRRPYAAQSGTRRREILAHRDAHHPAVVAQAMRHASEIQLRIADAVTAFAGSMRFVYLHVVLFAAWMVFFERSPWPTLTLVVSLEAIFLSTFVMISQNRSDEKSQVLADDRWRTVQHQEQQNEELLRAAAQILELTQAIHARDSRSPTVPR